MKNKKVIISLALVLGLIVLFIIIGFGKTIKVNVKDLFEKEYVLEEDTVIVKDWCNSDYVYEIFYTKLNSDIVVDGFNGKTNFETNATKKELIESNDDYVGEYKFINWGKESSASLFFRDDNCYALTGIDEENASNMYTVYTCIATLNFENCCNNRSVRFPCMVNFDISETMITHEKETGISFLDWIFDNYTFEEAEEFYERFSEDMVSIDKNKHTISVTTGTYTGTDETKFKHYLTLNFDEKNVSFKDNDGKLITVNRDEIIVE